jgi:hypothetical protein
MTHALTALSAAALLACPALAQEARPTAPAAPPATAPAQPAASITNADELLAALETADKDLTTFESDIVYTKTPNELVGGSPEVRKGKLWFLSRPAPPEPAAPSASPTPTPPTPPSSTDASSTPPANQRLFHVEFTTLELDGARRDDRQIWIFDGSWLTEKNFETRLVHRRQVVKPGEKADPLALGEGPLPIPIGQKREKITSRFDPTLAPSTDGAPKEAEQLLGETYQLVLKPKRGTQEARDYREVRIWYRKSDLLPRLARATHKDGSVTEILLAGMKVNKDFADTVFDTTTPKGWNEQIDDYREPKTADE